MKQQLPPEFTRQFNESVVGINRQIKKKVKQLHFAVLADIMKLTPVKTGRAKGGWNPASKDCSQATTDTKAMYEIRTENRVHYVVFLEYGKSRKAPNGMVRVTLERYRNILMRRSL